MEDLSCLKSKIINEIREKENIVQVGSGKKQVLHSHSVRSNCKMLNFWSIYKSKLILWLYLLINLFYLENIKILIN